MTAAPGLSLSGRYTLSESLLFEVDLRLPTAEWTCLLGPSGVGKSTILRLILGLPCGGAFEGEIGAADGQPLGPRVSYMAQTDLLLPWLTVLENTVLGAKLRGTAPDLARAETLLARVGLADHKAKKPAALSGGMRQRAALARTLMEDRPIVLLDEPFSALDAGTRADMQELAAEVLADKTVLLVTHDPGEAARLGHRILLMSAQRMMDWPVPPSEPVRDVSDAATMECQTALLSYLREARA